MFTPEQIQKLEAVLRRARDDRDYCAELAEDPIAILKADADVELPSGARTRSVASDDVDFTIVLSAKPAATPESEPIVVVVDHAGDYEDDDLEPIAHLEAAIPRIVEKSNTDSAFRTALVSDPVGTLSSQLGVKLDASIQVVDPQAADYTLIAPTGVIGGRHPVIALPGHVGGRVDPERTGVQLLLASEMAGELSDADLATVAGGTGKGQPATGKSSSSSSSSSGKG